MKFYICPTCGNVIELIEDHKVPVMCCGKKMEELVPNSTEAAVEKHMPVPTVENGEIGRASCRERVSSPV